MEPESMAMYLAKRFLTAVLMLVLISILIFAVLRLLPGDPTIAKLAGAKGISPEAVAALRHQLGLDRSLPSQYLSWIGGAIHGDFGTSYFSQYSVNQLIGQRLGATVELAVASLIVAVLFALVLAISPMVRDSKLLGRFVTGYTVLGLSAPTFIIGIGIQLLFGNTLHWLPQSTYVALGKNPGENLTQLITPAVTLGVAVSAPLINYLRASLRDVESAEYVRTAFGSGVRRRRVVLGHVVPNALLPALTALGVSVGALLGGVVEAEYVFGWPGMGSAIVNAVLTRDYAVIQSMVLLAATAYVLTTLVVDILYGVLDPRLRVATSKAATA
jgi:peptide/nickel transport system permease protein